MKTIVLTGMMGAGKSCAGENLAQNLNAEFLDIDFIIENENNLKISEIFEKYSETYFRDIEQKTILKVFQPENQVISLGGGAFENKTVREFLLKNSLVIYLKTSPKEIFERIKNNYDRPLLKNNMSVQKITEILKKREKNYKLAPITIMTDNNDIKKVVQNILGALK